MLGHGLVRGQHALFDERCGVGPRLQQGIDGHQVLVETELEFLRFEVHAAGLHASCVQHA